MSDYLVFMAYKDFEPIYLSINLKNKTYKYSKNNDMVVKISYKSMTYLREQVVKCGFDLA